MDRATLLVAVALAGICGGCAVQKDWIAIGGSRSDGTIKLAYEYGGFERPMVDNDAAMRVARLKCSAWGYTAAEPFEGVMRDCTMTNQYGCIRFRVTATFQCTGQPERSTK